MFSRGFLGLSTSKQHSIQIFFAHWLWVVRKCEVNRKQRLRHTHKLKCWVVSVKSSVFLWDLCKTDPLWHMVLHFSLPVWNDTNIPADTANMRGRPRPAGDQAETLRLVGCMRVPLKYWCYWENLCCFLWDWMISMAEAAGGETQHIRADFKAFWLPLMANGSNDAMLFCTSLQWCGSNSSLHV